MNIRPFLLRILSSLSLIAGAFFGIAAHAFTSTSQTGNALPPTDPRGLTIYQIMVASFLHDPSGAKGYTAMWGPDGERKNGNLAGVISSLDHIKSLGANAIWMTPIFDSSKASGGEKLQSTGYFTNDYFSIDPHFGTEEELRTLIDEAHKRGILVFLDGVFGHHGGVTKPSPKGHKLDTTITFCDRGEKAGTGNIRYPQSLPYMKEVATYWIDKFGIDGWRLDQAYQAMQGGHNYWKEISQAVDSVISVRKNRGEKFGIMGYLVGEDWGSAEVINKGVYRDGGLKSAFDFDGKERISGAMQDPKSEGLTHGYADIIITLSQPMARGYLNNDVLPNLFLTNHDGSRLADHFNPDDSLYYEKMMYRMAILAAYPGPVTLYYGDEYADRSLETKGGQPDNVSRTSGHLQPRTEGEARLRDYTAKVMGLRSAHPAMWRGNTAFEILDTPSGEVLEVRKTDPESGEKITILFSDHDAEVTVYDNSHSEKERKVKVKAFIPEFLVED